MILKILVLFSLLQSRENLTFPRYESTSVKVDSVRAWCVVTFPCQEDMTQSYVDEVVIMLFDGGKEDRYSWPSESRNEEMEKEIMLKYLPQAYHFLLNCLEKEIIRYGYHWRVPIRLYPKSEEEDLLTD